MPITKAFHVIALGTIVAFLIPGLCFHLSPDREENVVRSVAARPQPKRLRPQGFRVAVPDDLRLAADSTMRLLRPQLPPPFFTGSPTFAFGLNSPELEGRLEKNPPIVTQILIPEASRLISQGCPVSSSTVQPFVGEFSFVTDGEVVGEDGYYVELDPGIQWIEIDLGKFHRIDALWIWRFFKMPVCYLDVVIAVDVKQDFTKPQILFNSDRDNNIGFGHGNDLLYVETNFGRSLVVNRACGRYVRLYSRGRDRDEMNHYIEVAVYGR
jgi:hypothetical protein